MKVLTDQERLRVGLHYTQMTKAQLVDKLIEGGTIYPSRSKMLQWSKDELVSAATDMWGALLVAAGVVA